MKRQTYILGDIHGRIEALKEVLTKAKFDYDEDELIILGDIVDGGRDTYLVVEKLLKIKHTVFILGNHDKFFIDFFDDQLQPNIWVHQGGYNTLKSYKYTGDTQSLQTGSIVDICEFDLSSVVIPNTHKEFFRSAIPYLERDNMIFVHGGFNYPVHPKNESETNLLWNRGLITRCKNGLDIKDWDRVFVGHTQTESRQVETYGKLTCMDSGAGWNGRLALKNLNTDTNYYSKIQKPDRG